MSAPVRWLFLVCCTVAVSGCTKPNPNACCTNEAECLALGAEELRPCDGGEVCSANSCVPVQCDTSEQCSAATPYCLNQLCVGSCQGEADCQGVPGAPICAPDHVCVGCRDHSDCTGVTPICDAEDRQCRGCEADGDCASGICLEADGVCAAESEVVFVVPGRSDTGDCTKLAPCGTLEYALTKANAPRTTIRIEGGQQLLVGSTLAIWGRRLYVDSSGSTILYDGTAGNAMFDVASGGYLTIEGVRFAPGAMDFVATRAGTSRFHRVRIEGVGNNFLRVSGSSHLILHRLEAVSTEIECRDFGAATVTLSSFTNVVVGGTNCTLVANRNTFRGDGEALRLSGGTSTTENNLFVASNELADVLLITTQGAGSRFAFNTLVNITGVASDGQAMNCDAALRVENNIFAHRSRSPHVGGCLPRFSLYDSAYPSPPGEGNRSAPFESLFVNATTGDFRPAPSSPAREMSEAGATISIDHAGTPRPLPLGTRPDVGAFEVR